MPNGMDMLMKAVGLTPDKLSEMQSVATNVANLLSDMNARLINIEAQQKVILSYLQPDQAANVSATIGQLEPVVDMKPDPNQLALELSGFTQSAPIAAPAIPNSQGSTALPNPAFRGTTEEVLE